MFCTFGVYRCGKSELMLYCEMQKNTTSNCNPRTQIVERYGQIVARISVNLGEGYVTMEELDGVISSLKHFKQSR